MANRPDQSGTSAHRQPSLELVAIIGLSGSGSYVLDSISRTHLERIALFDDDKAHVHSIFRMPGFIPRAVGELKVAALARHYRQWHAGFD